jgi:hypothetical protein
LHVFKRVRWLELCHRVQLKKLADYVVVGLTFFET